MISVRNRLQLLNGSKLPLLLIVLVSLLSSCGLFRKESPSTPVKRVPPREISTPDEESRIRDDHKEEEVVTGKEEEPDKTVDKGHDVIDRSRSYEIAVLLSSQSASVDYTSERLPADQVRMINFYIGVQIAADSLKRKGYPVRLKTIDIENSGSSLRQLYNDKVLNNSDVIIGPVKSEHFETINTQFKDKWVISPWNNNHIITKNHNKIVLIRPGVNAFVQRMYEFALKKYDRKQVFIVHTGSAREKPFIEQFEKLIHIDNVSYKIVPKVFNISSGTSGLIAELGKNKDNLIIFPNHADQQAVFRFLNNMSNVFQHGDISVMGMPQWRDFSFIDYDIYEKFNIIIPEHFSPSLKDNEVLSFAENFMKKYGTADFKDAFYGYKLTMLSADILVSNNTRDFSFHQNYRLNHYSKYFSLSKVRLSHQSDDFDSDDYDFIENDKILFLQFRDYRFNPVE